MKIGEIIFGAGKLVLNEGQNTSELKVKNTSDRPIQVTSHYPFFEVNKKLLFDRDKSLGMRLDIPSGESIRFDPGEEKVVRLVGFSGRKRIMGFNGLTNGQALKRGFFNLKRKNSRKGI